MNYPEWEQGMPDDLRQDVLWKMKVYRLAMFLADIAWEDVSLLAKDSRTKSLSNQLYRAVGSVCANLKKDTQKRARRIGPDSMSMLFGSARESRGWYYRARHLLKTEVYEHRSALLTEIIKLLLTIIPKERSRVICESPVKYTVDSHSEVDVPF
jgi:four helix bundle protein